MSSTTNNINSKPCAYGCGIQIYWNSSVNEYWEVFTKKKYMYFAKKKSVSSRSKITINVLNSDVDHML